MVSLIPDVVKRIIGRCDPDVGESLRKVVAAVEEADYLAAEYALKQLPDETSDPILNQAVRLLRELVKKYSRYEKYLESMYSSPLLIQSLKEAEIVDLIAYANKRGVKLQWKTMIIRDATGRPRTIPVLIRTDGIYDAELR